MHWYLEICRASHLTALIHNSKLTNLPSSLSFEVWKRLIFAAYELRPSSLSTFRTHYILYTPMQIWYLMESHHTYHIISYRFHYRCAPYLAFSSHFCMKFSYKCPANDLHTCNIILWMMVNLLFSIWQASNTLRIIMKARISELELPKLELQQGPCSHRDWFYITYLLVGPICEKYVKLVHSLHIYI